MGRGIVRVVTLEEWEFQDASRRCSVNNRGTLWPQALLSSKFCSGVNGERTTYLPVIFKSRTTNYHWCSHVSVSGSVLHTVCALSHLIPKEKKWNRDSEKLVNGEIDIQPWISATLHWAALVPQKALRRIRINSWFALSSYSCISKCGLWTSSIEILSEMQGLRPQPRPAAAAKSLQLCPTLCDPIDSSSRGSPVLGILQARTVEWVAISSSNAWKWKVKLKLLSRVWLLVTPWTAAYQTSPSMGFSRQEYRSGVPLPSPN